MTSDTTTTFTRLYDTPMPNPIVAKCEEVQTMLLQKNRKYGNSALEPTRIFSKTDPLEQLRVRIDDKLSRVISSQGDEDEDVVMDLTGYLILYLVALDDGKNA